MACEIRCSGQKDSAVPIATGRRSDALEPKEVRAAVKGVDFFVPCSALFIVLPSHSASNRPEHSGGRVNGLGLLCPRKT